MFWKFHVDSSAIDTLLAKQDVTLKEILDEDDVLQECKTQNGKLIEFLAGDEILKELLHMVVSEPSQDVQEAYQYKYMNLACEVLTLDIYTILNKVASNSDHLDIIWSFINSPSPLNPLLASFFSKVFTILISRKGAETIEFLKSRDAVNKLIVHIEISAIMELFIKMVTVVETTDLRLEVSKWLNEERLIEKLTQVLHPSEKEEKHYNVAQLMSELIRMGRDSISQYVETEDDPLLLTIEKKEIIENILSTIFDERKSPNFHSSIINGMTILSSMIEIKRSLSDCMEEFITPMDVERISLGVCTTLQVLASHVKDFHSLLVHPQSSTMETTHGLLDPPLGKVRLNIAALFSTAVATNTSSISQALADSGTINVLLDLFSQYEWNNFLHTYVQQCIVAILNSETAQSDGNENDDEKNTMQECCLLKHLYQSCDIIGRCVALWECNEISQKSGGHRKGYMGHLTQILNAILMAHTKGPNSELIKDLFNELSEETKEEWNILITGPLNELNKINICATINPITSFESDSDADDYRPISNLSQAMQQKFENYQVKPMTHEFVETFGFDENSVEDNDDFKNPFDEVGNIDFGIKANKLSENEKLFENICVQKIQPFDESSSDEEENIWEEKQLSSVQKEMDGTKDESLNETDSSDEEDKNESNVFKQEERMEVDQEWTANFDNMDVQDNSSNWSAKSVKENSADFADFTNIYSVLNNGDESAMETEPGNKSTLGAAYEVKMEEETDSAFHEETKPQDQQTSIETKMVGSYVVVNQVEKESKDCERQVAPATEDVKVESPKSLLTSITVKSIKSEQNESTSGEKQETKIDNDSSPSSTDEAVVSSPEHGKKEVVQVNDPPIETQYTTETSESS